MAVTDAMHRTIAEQHDEITALKNENAKLREQADFEHFHLEAMRSAAGMMLDEYSALLNEHNRLRKLCNDLLLCISADYDCYGCRYDEWEDCRDGCRLIARAKEFGIEVREKYE